jgi:outer membrane protein TolC
MELSYQQRGAAYSNMLSLQVSIDLPLFAERRQNRDTAAKLAQVEQARALREDALRQHLAEAAVARADWEAASARLKRFDDALLPLARARAQLALAAYRGGAGPLASVLEARRMELDLRVQKLQLDAEQGRAYAQFIYFLPEEAAK